MPKKRRFVGPDVYRVTPLLSLRHDDSQERVEKEKMTRRLIRKVLVSFLALNLCAAGATQSAFAALIGTQTAIQSEQRAGLVSRVQGKLARKDVHDQFIALGVAPEEVNQRLAALTDEELIHIDKRLDALPAGAGAIEVIGVVFLVLLILELVGVIDIFKKI
jgi:hypothetical protein